LTRIFRDVYANHSSYKDKAMKARQIADTMRIEMVSKMLDRELSER
jgi:hypothetical protein